MDAVMYLKEKKKMCEKINDCNKCPLYQQGGIACMLFERDYPEDAVEYVEQYQEDGKEEKSRWLPVDRTYREKLEEISRRKGTVIGMLNDIATEICDHYCKYADRYFEDQEELTKCCWECPLNGLGN